MLRACQLLTPAEKSRQWLSELCVPPLCCLLTARLRCLTTERRGVKEGEAPIVSFPTGPPTWLVPTLGAKMLHPTALQPAGQHFSPAQLQSREAELIVLLALFPALRHQPSIPQQKKKNRSGRAEKERGAIFQNIYTHKQQGIKMGRSSFNINANISSGALIMWSNLSREVV